MANNLFFQADGNPLHAPTGNPITEAEAVAMVAHADSKLRWNGKEPEEPGYDPVPVYIHDIAIDHTATFSLVNAETGKPIKEHRFTVRLDDRDVCHGNLPSTPRFNFGGDKRIVILMLCPTYHQGAKADTGKLMVTLAAESSIALSATGKWPRTEAAAVKAAESRADAAEATLARIAAKAAAGNEVSLDFIRESFREVRRQTPDIWIPAELQPL